MYRSRGAKAFIDLINGFQIQEITSSLYFGSSCPRGKQAPDTRSRRLE